MLPNHQKKLFSQKIIDWFKENGASYPWRETTNPYKIWISEVMLQQTRIATILEKKYYTNWLTTFPDIKSLAESSEQQILKQWEGLGYYSRARNLQKAAKIIMAKHKGKMPEDVELLESLPGIGKYTSRAIASFSYNNFVPIVDGNIMRVLARLNDYKENIDLPKNQNQLWKWADELLTEKNSKIYNSGLMEIGQTICVRTNPRCNACPIKKWCKAKDPNSLPIKTVKPPAIKKEELCLFLIRNNQILLEQEKGSLRKDFWKLPSISNMDYSDWPLLYEATYPITKFKVTLRAYKPHVTWNKNSLDHKWIHLEDLVDLPIATPHRKAIDTLKKERQAS